MGSGESRARSPPPWTHSLSCCAGASRPRMSAIQIEQLSVRFGDLLAVDRVSLVAEPGEVYGLLGPNGAGKSTTVGALSGLLRPTSGRCLLNGHDVAREGARARAGLGLVPQELALYGELDARANLRFFGAAQGLGRRELERRIPEILERVGLAGRDREPVERFSGGMKRRLNLACGLVHSPSILLLDEPTVGVDPQSRVRLLELVREERERGTCVLYTTHYMEEAEALCDRLGIVDEGRLIAEGGLEELRRRAGQKDVLRLSGEFSAEEFPAHLAQTLPDVELLSHDAEHLTLSVAEAGSRLSEIFAALSTIGATVRETTLNRASLESLFIGLTGKELRE